MSGGAGDVASRIFPIGTPEDVDVRYQSLLEALPDGFTLQGADGVIQAANRTAERILGLTREQLMGRTSSDPRWKAIHEDGTPYSGETHPAMVTLRTGRAIRDAVMGISHGLGEVRWISINTMPVFEPGTALPVAVGAIFADITARKQAEKALRKSEARMGMLVRAAGVGLMDWDLVTNEVYFSPEWKRQLGYAEDEMPNRLEELTSRVHPADVASRRAALEDFQSGRRPNYDHEFRLLHRDGSWRWMFSRVDLIRDAAGVPVRMMGCHFDITERKRAEEQLLRAQRVESIGTLATGIAHDLNNVLGPIIMSLAVLKKRFPDPGSADLIDTLAASAHTGADMLKQVLAFAKGVEGRRVAVQVRFVIEAIAKLGRDTFPKDILWRTNLPCDLWTVHADPTHLHQVLLNLAVNARDAMGGGGILTISAMNVAYDPECAARGGDTLVGPCVLIEVADTGSGIAPELMERIFDPFFTTKEIGMGTGLGLSTSMTIVKSLGGRMCVSSEQGSGTKFQVWLPVSATSVTEDHPTPEVQVPPVRGERILVADDDGNMREVAEMVLGEFGYQVLLARDGEEAIAILAQNADLSAALIDVNMPGMGGAATVRAIRKIAPALPVILSSGLRNARELIQGGELDAHHFLPKPYSGEALLAAIQGVVAPARSEEQRATGSVS